MSVGLEVASFPNRGQEQLRTRLPHTPSYTTTTDRAHRPCPLPATNHDPSTPHHTTSAAAAAAGAALVRRGLGGGWLAAAAHAMPTPAQHFQRLLDKSTPHVTGRWVSWASVVLIYMLRVWYLRGFYIVSYGLGIYNLNLLLGFLTPQIDPEQEGPELPTSNDQEFRPFIRRLPEFKFWCVRPGPRGQGRVWGALRPGHCWVTCCCWPGLGLADPQAPVGPVWRSTAAARHAPPCSCRLDQERPRAP